jgi:hypothetical protein
MCAPEIRKSISFPPFGFDKTQQGAGENLEQETLANDQGDGDESIGFPLMLKKIIQPLPEKMQDEKKIAHHQHGINEQFNEERSKNSLDFPFHSARGVVPVPMIPDMARLAWGL